LVAKILVADDNSNIQKMVGLALKDQGIDVVAVGNGEAAVRKISDVRPDLVLADVFMPVRNGYEVCQYVKGDSALSHIPVILLVGAFDPLDEQEAQRVGADGVLKKPFVPPDPLISMVKSALARAGVAVGGVAPALPAKEEPIRAAELLSPRTLPSMSSLGPVPDYPSVESEPVHEAVAEKPEPVKIDAGSQPLAFGSLLETPGTEQEEDLGFATTARPELERDWHSGEEVEEEVEEEAEEKHSASWRRDAGDDSMEEEGDSRGAEKDWRETAFSDTPAHKSRESWTPQKEVSGFAEAAEAEQSISAVISEAPVAETKLAPAPVAPFAEDAWSAALNHKTTTQTATMEPPAPPKLEPVPEVHAEAPASPPVLATPAQEPAKPAGGSSWYSTVSSPWEAEAQKASKLASTWDDTPGLTVPEPSYPSIPQVAAKEDPTATVDTLPESLSPEVKAKVEEAALPAATVEAIREETQYVAENALEEVPKAASPASVEPKMEDLVAKVLAKMSPDMLQAVTREILKPVVEAMIKDELNSKK
jgi:CheY-like chemotaxis protein